MFGWLFGKKPSSCILEMRDQDVITFWDGQKTVIGDPEQILRSLSTDPDCNFELDWKKVQLPIDTELGITEALGAYDRLTKAGRKAFKVKQASEGGLTDKSVAELLLRFVGWLDSQKKSMPALPTSAKPTEPASLADLSAKASSLDSTFVGHVPMPAEQPSSQPQSA